MSGVLYLGNYSLDPEKLGARNKPEGIGWVAKFSKIHGRRLFGTEENPLASTITVL